MARRALPKRENRRFPILVVLTSIAATIACLAPAGAAAAGFEVTSTGNAGPGSLRAAIQAADETAGADTIALKVAGAIVLTSELPPLKGRLSIEGTGPETITVTRSQNAPDGFSIFTVFPNSTVEMSDLGVTNGENPTGGGIRSFGSLTLDQVHVTNNVATQSGGANAKASGGGIWSSGPLTLRESLVAHNSALAIQGSASSEALGGGVAALGGAVVWRSTIAENISSAFAGRGKALGSAGGIAIEGGGTEAIELSTVAGNTARAQGSAATMEAVAGGILGAAKLTIGDATVVGNSLAGATTKGANVEAGSALIRDSILARPQGAPDCGAALDSGGFNIDEDGSCGLRTATDHSNVAPGLAPALAANGGPTPTFALLPGGVAIDQGKAFGATTDQRGEPRPAQSKGVADAPGGDGSDIGSYELEPGGGDQTPPQTFLDVVSTGAAPEPSPTASARPLGLVRATFIFHADEMGATFQCRIDGGRYRSCQAPFRTRVIPGRRHVFSVRAIDVAGNVDRTPAHRAFRVG